MKKILAGLVAVFAITVHAQLANRDAYGSLSFTTGGNADFKLFAQKTGSRSMTHIVKFSPPLVKAPAETIQCFVSISGFGLTDKSAGQLVIRTAVEEIDTNFFALKMSTYGSTIFEALDLNYHCHVQGA